MPKRRRNSWRAYQRVRGASLAFENMRRPRRNYPGIDRQLAWLELMEGNAEEAAKLLARVPEGSRGEPGVRKHATAATQLPRHRPAACLARADGRECRRGGETLGARTRGFAGRAWRSKTCDGRDATTPASTGSLLGSS